MSDNIVIPDRHQAEDVQGGVIQQEVNRAIAEHAVHSRPTAMIGAERDVIPHVLADTNLAIAAYRPASHLVDGVPDRVAVELSIVGASVDAGAWFQFVPIDQP